MILPETIFRTPQKLMASVRLYGVKLGRRDSITNESSEENYVNDAEKLIPLWFGKVLLFLCLSLQNAVLNSIAAELVLSFCSISKM